MKGWVFAGLATAFALAARAAPLPPAAIYTDPVVDTALIRLESEILTWLDARK